jgi:glycosyltransferase involved in cell wall biosynthesis
MEPVTGTTKGPSSVFIVIPALNEEEPIGDVVRAVIGEGIGEVIVVDNGSTDSTAERARGARARVVSEPRRGYGRACMAGVAALPGTCEIVAFLDGDGSDCPEFLGRVIGPIQAGEQDFVIGSRIRGKREPGSLNIQQRIAAHLFGWLLRRLYGVRYTDMGPLRAIRRDALLRLGMREQTYGWNLEMQMRAAKAGLRILEIPADHRLRRGGESKVSGNLRGTIKAASRILLTVVRLALELRQAAAS